MTPTQSEQQDNDRLKKAAEAIEYYKAAETEARKALARATEQTAIARKKRDDLFAECERRAVERRRSGLIETKTGY